MKHSTCKKLSALIITCTVSFFLTECRKVIDAPNVSDEKINAAISRINALSTSIVYTDLNPDSVVRAIHRIDLDVNNDKLPDFIFSVYYSAPLRCTCEFGGQSRMNYISASASNGSSNQIELNNNYPAVLDTLDIINANKIWSAPTSSSSSILRRCYALCCTGGVFSGNWISTTEYKYLGLKFIVGTNTYYGWVRLKVVVTAFFLGGSLTVKDYAYNSTPNQQILAGQMK